MAQQGNNLLHSIFLQRFLILSVSDFENFLLNAGLTFTKTHRSTINMNFHPTKHISLTVTGQGMLTFSIITFLTQSFSYKLTIL